jgi:two-component system alkaline phosphatase synthesis response regulator PhoP
VIFCVEDDNSIRELMIYTLGVSGFEAIGCENAAAFWDALKRIKNPQLVLLDIMLPDEDGISILKKLRSYALTADIPVIMATAKGTEYDKVIGLDQGADDYLAKPFGMMEMVSRVKAVLRRTNASKKERMIRLGTMEIDEKRHSVTVGGKKINLTLKEYELLRLLIKNPGKVFTRDELLLAVWDSDFRGETRTVDVHVGTLRSKIGKEGARIETVRGVGYRMSDSAKEM